jgi:biopolymer transport protein ExbB/TolQ
MEWIGKKRIMMARTERPKTWPYLSMVVALVAAVGLPVGLAVFNPTLMFERGWEQFAGSGLFLLAIAALSARLWSFWREEQGLIRAGESLNTFTRRRQSASPQVAIRPGGELIAPLPMPAAGDSLAEKRFSQLLNASRTSGLNEFQQIMELNREQSALDQEHEAGRFTFTKYILYLLPVIGFIGTVEGISKALANISVVLPMVKDLDGFMNNLTSVTSALQIAFDSTLLALFLSATLMFIQTMMLRRAEDLLSRIDRWVVDHALVPLVAGESLPEKAAAPAEAAEDLTEERWENLLQSVDEIARALGVGLGPQTERLQTAVDRLAQSLSGMDVATQRLGDLGGLTQQLGKMSELGVRSTMALERIEHSMDALASRNRGEAALESVRQSVERTTTAVESLNAQFQQSFEKSSRQSQENLARTLASLKDAIELINVSIEQGNTLYRGIVRTMFDQREADSVRRVG